MVDIMQSREINQPPRDLATTTTTTETSRMREGQTTAEVASGGSLAVACCGIAAIVLTIVGLAGTFPFTLCAIAVIVAGAGLILEGSATGARFAKLLGEVSDSSFSSAELGGGVTAEFAAGASAVVLGILALIGIVPSVLMAVAAIVAGAALLLGASTSASLNSLALETRFRTHEMARRVAGTMVSGSAGMQVLIGLAAIILGIVGLASHLDLVLILVSFLVIGAALTICGLAVSAKMLQVTRR
jgi:hypothetical protein